MKWFKIESLFQIVHGFSLKTTVKLMIVQRTPMSLIFKDEQEILRKIETVNLEISSSHY